MTRTDIVVGIDGSVVSGSALDFAIAEAAALQTNLIVIHAWRPRADIQPEIIRVPLDPFADELEAKRNIEAAVDEALIRAPRSPAAIRTELVEGDATDVLLDRAADARQLIVGTHGRGVAGRALLGSVADRLTTFAAGPVTVVPPPDHSGPGDGRIVVGVDGSASSQLALSFAATEAALHNAPLTVVFAYPAHHLAVEGVPRSDMADAGRKLIGDMLDVMAFELRHSVAAIERLAIAADPAPALLEVANRASQLVVGFGETNSRFGSVSRRCVHHAPCPTTVVKT